MKNVSKTLQKEFRETLDAGGCPLCRLQHRDETRFLDSLTYERILDLETRDKLKASRGLCEPHVRAWREVRGSALGIALVYEIAVKDLLEDSDAQPPGGLFGRARSGTARIADAMEAQAACPACEVGADTVARYTKVLLHDIQYADIETALEAAGGLCLPHLRFVLRRRGPDRAQRLVLEVQRRVWQSLRAELKEFIRKNDYRFRDEPKGAERDSWLRAIDAVVGLDLEA
jgi:hypothetical protein